MLDKENLFSYLQETEKEAQSILESTQKTMEHERQEVALHVQKLRQNLEAKKEALKAVYQRQIEEEQSLSLEQLAKKIEQDKAELKNQVAEKLPDLLAYLLERGL